MSGPKSGYFCVYTTVSVDDDAVVTALNRGQFDNPPDQTQWSSPQAPVSDRSPSAIIAHHRQSSGMLDPQYIVICDRLDWATTSVLAVNLDFKGWEDGARMEVGVAGDAIPSVSISNTEWEENLGASQELWPKDRFAVYVTARCTSTEREALIQALNSGLGGRKAWTMGGEVCRDATGLLPEDGEIDLPNIASLHKKAASQEGFDPVTFILAKHADWQSSGVSIVRADGEELDVSDKPAEFAAEILTWVHQGLYTWTEGKNWSKKN